MIWIWISRFIEARLVEEGGRMKNGDYGYNFKVIPHHTYD